MFKFNFRPTSNLNQRKPNSTSYKILLGICSVVVSVFAVYLYVHAGNIDSPGIPASAGRMYTLQNIYDYLTSTNGKYSAAPSKPSSFNAPASAPAATMHTTDEIFAKITRPPATGQTTVYQTNDDGTYQSGSTLSYTDNGNGTITDNNTKLMWVKQPELIIPGATGVTSTNQIQSAKGAWTTSTVYAKGDLVKAVEATPGMNASKSGTTVTAASGTPFTSADIGREIFIAGVSVGIGRSIASSPNVAITVSTSATVSSGALTIQSYYVCAVAHTSGTFLTDLGAGYWRETLWTASASNLTTPSQMRWDNSAIVNCEALDYAGYQDWRLPNLKELISIADYGRVGPAINPVFTNTQSDYYWSSTTYAGFAIFAWYVFFSDGGPVNGVKSYAYYVRCVRGQ